ncbi:MAG: permease prefix domain 1-containing protein [Clostridium sp.]|jgi:ABC-type Fe3+-siderophore transport system permease subunit|nr:permease prefix domain 1-containing protein [Clostridium sp.]
MMDTRKHIDALFLGYEETAALADFKEELRSNLDDRIASLCRKGLDEKAAFRKAAAELGDISALADEISLKKKQEVYSEMYMKTRNYMDTKRVALYVLCGATLCFGVITALLTRFHTPEPSAPMGVLLVFGGIAVLGFVFLGLTQETAAQERMSPKRAFWYVAASGILLFGLFVFGVTYFYSERGIADSVATLIPFALPGAALGIFLILTEKDRRKPWVRKLADEQLKREMERFASPAQAERFGLISGALWIAAVTVFIVLTLRVGLLYSWLAFAGALVAQLLVLALLSKGSQR